METCTAVYNCVLKKKKGVRFLPARPKRCLAGLARLNECPRFSLHAFMMKWLDMLVSKANAISVSVRLRLRVQIKDESIAGN